MLNVQLVQYKFIIGLPRMFFVLLIDRFRFHWDFAVYLGVRVWLQLSAYRNYRDLCTDTAVPRHRKRAAVRDKIHKDISNSLGKRSRSGIHTTALSS